MKNCDPNTGRAQACASYWRALLCGFAAAICLGCTEFGVNLDGPLPSAEMHDVSHTESIDGDQWLSWRGGAQHGVSPCTSLPVEFSAIDNVKWKVSLSGNGNSSPVVVGDLVCLTRSIGRGHRAQLEIVSFDRETGETRWTRNVGRPYGTSHQRNGHASATIASDGQHLLAYFGAKGLYCFTIEGTLLWHHPYHDAVHEWGAASSPVVAGGLAIQLVESSKESFLAAYDVHSGEQRWRTQRDSNGCWSTPIVTQIGGRWQVVVNGSGSEDGSSGNVTGYDLATGNVQWDVKGTSDIVCPTVIAGDGLLVSATGANGPVLALNTDEPQPNIAWQLASGGAYVPTGLIYRERLYLVDDDGIMRCIVSQDGSTVWKQRLGAPVSASLVAAAGQIYVTAESGQIFVVAAGDTFQLLAENVLSERMLATPAIAGDAMFVRGESNLYCISHDAQASTLPAADLTTPSPSDAVFVDEQG